jgi:hypothetical protein
MVGIHGGECKLISQTEMNSSRSRPKNRHPEHVRPSPEAFKLCRSVALGLARMFRLILIRRGMA